MNSVSTVTNSSAARRSHRAARASEVAIREGGANPARGGRGIWWLYTADGGNFGTSHQDVSLAGAVHSFDYFSEFSRFDTQGSLPNTYFHNATVSGNFGWQLTPATTIRATVRHESTGLGSPNALDLYGIPDDAFQTN